MRRGRGPKTKPLKAPFNLIPALKNKQRARDAERLAKRLRVECSIFYSQKLTIGGVCLRALLTPIIILNPERSQDKINDPALKPLLLLAHELAHCYIKGHDAAHLTKTAELFSRLHQIGYYDRRARRFRQRRQPLRFRRLRLAFITKPEVFT